MIIRTYDTLMLVTSGWLEKQTVIHIFFDPARSAVPCPQVSSFHVLHVVSKIFASLKFSCTLPVNLFRHPRHPPDVFLQPHNK